MTKDKVPEFDKAASVRAIRFEYQMALEMAPWVSMRKGLTHEEFVTGIAFLESFLVHVRSLDEFLESRGGRKTDVRASDFVPGFEDKTLDPDLLKSINRRLQHITVHRQADNTRWIPMEILPPVVSAMGRFVAELEKADPESAEVLSETQERAEAMIGMS